MAIKELAYSAQQHLQSNTECSFKRAHIYELLASSFGFNSYASLCSSHVFTKRDESKTSLEHNQAILQQRVVELGYDPTIAEVVATEFLSFVNQQHIGLVGVNDLINELSDGDSFLEEYWFPSDNGEYPPILLESLEEKAGKGDHLAHYALALLFQVDDEDNSRSSSGEYWYIQGQQGRDLSGVEKEWADAYARQLEKSEKHTFHLREAGRLGNSSALLALAELFNDPSYLDAAKACGITDDLIEVAELAETLGRKEDAEHWLTVAAEAGDIDAMRRLIDDYEHNNVQRSWMWLYLAQMLGTDLTKSHLQAFHDGGINADRLYDDDIGGPLYVAGDEGVEMTPLDEEGKLEARKLAEGVFRRIPQST